MKELIRKILKEESSMKTNIINMINNIDITNVIKFLGGFEVIREIFSDDELKSLIYDYLDNNWTPDNGWKDSKYYSDYIKRYGTYEFKVNGELEYTYTMSSYAGVTRLHILSDLYTIMRDSFGDEENWVDTFKEWFENKTNMAVDKVI